MRVTLAPIYPTTGVGGGMLTSLQLAHIRDATLMFVAMLQGGWGVGGGVGDVNVLVSCAHTSLYLVGKNAGMAAFVCRKLFASKDSRCFQYHMMSRTDIDSMSRFFRNEHDNLQNRLRRGGRGDAQARG